MEKYTVPNLPSNQHVLEDVCDNDVVNLEFPLKLSMKDEMLDNAYACFRYCKALREDERKQYDLNNELQMLNKKLLDNITNLKALTKT